jgi:hypothetical protein
MITYAQATDPGAREFWHVSEKNADGSPTRARRNGVTQTWKTRPGLFQIPVKHGLHGYGYIRNFDDGDPVHLNNAHRWCVPERWEAEHVLFEGVTP